MLIIVNHLGGLQADLLGVSRGVEPPKIERNKTISLGPHPLLHVPERTRYCPGPGKLQNLIAIAIGNAKLEGYVRIVIASRCDT